MEVIICDYCYRPAERVTGKEVYPRISNLHGKTFYKCTPCEAHVGCHPGTVRALGRLANKDLRRLKVKAHTAFDPLWKKGPFGRGQAYQWLAEKLGISLDECHIGMFSQSQCLQTITICREYEKEKKA